jgi:RP/EB family microtubule-associated protein
MMDHAYFVGRGELLDFFNNLLDLHLAKIEQTASGAIACQLTEYVFPGSIPMSKVNWEAKSDYEFVNNYKLLQKAFTKHKIQRYVDVDKLIRAKYQDNLEFCQWLKAFYDQSGVVREDYDPNAMRARGKGGKKYNDLFQKTAAKHNSKPLPAARARGVARVTPAPKARPATTPTPKTTAPKPRTTASAVTRTANKAPLKASENRTRPVVGSSQPTKASADAQLMKKNSELESKIEEIEATVMEIEKERDFYFSKLRNVELMLQVKQDLNFEGCDLEGVVGNVFKVLYATAEEDVEVAEDGEVGSF